MITIQGKGISDGVAVGFLRCRPHKSPIIHFNNAESPETEWDRFLSARTETICQLDRMKKDAREKAGYDASMIFEAHQQIAEDVGFSDNVRQRIFQNGQSAEAAVSDTASQYIRKFASMKDLTIKERAADIRDVSDKILSVLMKEESKTDAPPNQAVILMADDLSPSEMLQLDKKWIQGIVLTEGSAAGHMAILARAMKIPAIIGVGDQLKPEYEGYEVIIDGSTGNVVLDADEATKDHLLTKREEQLEQQKTLEELKGKENITLDGCSIRIYCNISNPEDVSAVLANDGGGIGLFRSEFLYLNCDDYPTEDYQFEAYKKVLSDMDGKEVIIRTLDIGADKQIDYFELPKEENPALGNRALRICLERPEIFRTQLRALYRASAYGKLCIMFPMVTSVWEVKEARKMCDQVKKDLDEEGIPYSPDVEIGIMIETPAAAIMSDRFAKLVDFFSCGTNDLTQYTLACDRQNNDLGRFFDPHHPAVLRLLKMVCDNAHKNGVRVGICGELGADLDLTETFLSIGIDELSVSPRSVLPLRQKIRETDAGAVKDEILKDLMGDTITI